MYNLQIFKNDQFGQVRTLMIDGVAWLVGKDIANALGYKNTNVALQDNVDAEDKGVTKVTTAGGVQDAVIINESGLYALVLGSKLQSAKAYRKWVTAEVLPSIRITGGYVSNEDLFLETYLPNSNQQTKLLFKATLNTMKELNQKIEQDKPQVAFANAVKTAQTSILVGDLAKIIRQNGVEIGQKRFFEWLRENNYLMKFGESKNMPTQRSMELGLFEVKESTVSQPDGTIRITKTSKVTGKGQVYFVNKFLQG